MRQGDQVQASFWFLKKFRSKQVVSTLVLIYFGRNSLGQMNKSLKNKY